MFAFVEEHIRDLEEHMMYLQRQYDYFLEHKDEEMKERIIHEISLQLPIMQSTVQASQVELNTRKDYNEFEKYLVERMIDDLTLLIKHYNKLLLNLKPASLVY